jgi:hypothetical protein
LSTEKYRLIRDPLYRAIIERLKDRLDPDLFERCVADLLRDEWPTLVPVRGGTDAGMDAAIAEGEGPAFPLVCTTGQDVIGNLTRSLNSYLRDGGSRRQVVLATSQGLSQRRRRNLEKRAEEKGFVLVQVYDQAAMADRLYRSPAWSQELLNLTGTPTALSVLPLTKRPLLGETLVGREDDIAWLRGANGDRVLVGVPGSGKTFLLHKLAMEGWGLFVTSDDITEVAGALRAQQPPVLIVDDAHLNPGFVVELRRLKDEIDADFSIVATTWRGESDEIVEALNVTNAQVRELQLLTRDEIVSVIENSGVRAPVELLREIVNQAEGRPGLAVTLAYLCLRGGVREVALGEVLKRSTVTAFERLVGEETTQVLAAFALGGDDGMRPTAVSKALELPRYRVYSAVARLAAGGVVDKVRSTITWSSVSEPADSVEGESLAVRPPNLRYALVRDVFFGGPPTLPSGELIEAASNVTGVVHTLIGAAAYGARVPSDLLTSLLEHAESADAWTEYAALGVAEATWVLTNHPEFTIAAADAALARAPKAAIPRLLLLAVGDGRPLNSSPNHPLRRLEGWIQEAFPGTGQALPRRELLVEGVAAWFSEGGDKDVGVRALRMAMSPAFNDYVTDPGAGMTVTFREGLLLPDEISRLKALWLRVVELIEHLTDVPWRYPFEIIHDWAYPNFHIPRGEARQEVAADMRAFAERMLADSVRISHEHPGVLHEAYEYIHNLGWNLELTPDREFEVLFPVEDFKDWHASQEQQADAVRKLAAEWSDRDPEDVARRVARLEAAARDVDKSFPRHTPALCEEIAARTAQPMAWLRALLDNRATPDLMVPFLSGAASSGEDGWEESARQCLEDPNLRFATIPVVLTAPDSPLDLLSDVLERMGGCGSMVRTRCLRGEVPESTVAALLRHEDYEISTAAAIGEWHAEPKGEVRECLLPDWRAAMLRASTDEPINEALKADPALAHDWLRERAGDAYTVGFSRLRPAVEDAVSVLNREQRLSVLRSLRPTSMLKTLASSLVGDDLDLYRAFLQDEESAEVRLWPLTGRPTELWSEKAKLALEAGFTPRKVAGAAYSGDMSWSGTESGMWNTWAEQFGALLAHEDEGVRAVAEIGQAYAQQQRQKAVEEEH